MALHNKIEQQKGTVQLLKISKIASIACYLHRPRKMDTFITILLKSKLIQPLKYTYTVNQKSINSTNGNTQIQRHIPGYSRMFTEVLFKMTNNLENTQMPINKKCTKSFPIRGMSYNQINNSMVTECKKKGKNELIYRTEIE